MSEEINDTLLDRLDKAHMTFNDLINKMKEREIKFPYDDVITMEDKSFHISYNAISRMNNLVDEYNLYAEKNNEFRAGEIIIYGKYILLYLVSIIMIRVFSKTLSAVKINEIWYALVGLVLGSANANIINKRINDYRYGNKESREFVNIVKTLKENYDNDFEIAYREISYMNALNRNLIKELLPKKLLIKK